MVYFRIRSRMDAEDLTQDIFLQALRNVSGLRDFELFRPWLFRIAVNRVRDFHRKKRILSFFSFFRGDEDPETLDTKVSYESTAVTELMKREFWGRVEQLSARLSPMEREVFALRFVDHLSIREISEALDRSESAVKTHLYRSLKKFREDAGFLELVEGQTP